MPIAIVCARCGKMLAYVYGDARRLTASLGSSSGGVKARCPECAAANKARRMCRCGRPLPYRTTTGRVGACVWNDWPREGPVRDEPIQCRCRVYAEADPID